MDLGLAWINDVAAWFAQWMPRWDLCEPTHAGVKFRGRLTRRGVIDVIKIEPGVYWWWPATTRCCTIPVVRQSVDLPTQSLDTKDGHPIMASAVLVVEISDVVKALTANYDVDDTIAEIGAAAAVDCVVRRTRDALLESFAEGAIDEELQREATRILRKYGVRVIEAHFTDCCRHTPLRCEGGVPAIPTEA